QALFEFRLEPGAGHHVGATRGLPGIDDLESTPDLLRCEHSLLDEKLLHREIHQLVATGGRNVVRLERMGSGLVVIVIVGVIVRMRVVATHYLFSWKSL